MNISFAPIQGYTDAAYRKIHNDLFGGIEQYYTPFIRLEKGAIRKQDAKEFSAERNGILFDEGKIIPQILPGDGEEAEALCNAIVEQGYKQIDINMGCPFPMIAKRQKGCGLLPHPESVKSILVAIAKFPEVKFSVKMRLGLEDCNEWKALADMLNDAQLEHITMHPRIGKQQYNGTTDMTCFAEFVETIKHPVIYNGDVTTIEQAKKIVEEFPNIKGLMIGRGLLSNPALSWEIANNRPMDKKDLAFKIEQLNERLIEAYNDQYDGGEGQVVKKMLTVWDYLLPEIEKRAKKKIVKSKNLQDFIHNVNEAMRGYANS